jgi:hypothetical protein
VLETIDPQLGQGGDEAPQRGNAPVGLNIRLVIGRVPFGARVVRRERGVEVAAGKGFKAAANHLHVLLRHR